MAGSGTKQACCQDNQEWGKGEGQCQSESDKRARCAAGGGGGGGGGFRTRQAGKGTLPGQAYCVWAKRWRPGLLIETQGNVIFHSSF